MDFQAVYIEAKRLSARYEMNYLIIMGIHRFTLFVYSVYSLP